MSTLVPVRHLLTVAEAARRLRLSEKTVRRRIRAGELPALRLGDGRAPLRVSADELDAWIAERRTESAVGSGSSADHASSAVGTDRCVG
jgi:excisionase family DNA binding protein